MPSTIKSDSIISSKDSMKTKLALEILQLDRDVFAIAILDIRGNLEAFAAKDFFARDHHMNKDAWEKEATRNASIVHLANEEISEYNPASGIVFFRKQYKQILIIVPSHKIIIEAIMPLWNHSAVFYDSVYKRFAP